MVLGVYLTVVGRILLMLSVLVMHQVLNQSFVISLKIAIHAKLARNVSYGSKYLVCFRCNVYFKKIMRNIYGFTLSAVRLAFQLLIYIYSKSTPTQLGY